METGALGRVFGDAPQLERGREVLHEPLDDALAAFGFAAGFDEQAGVVANVGVAELAGDVAVEIEGGDTDQRVFVADREEDGVRGGAEMAQPRGVPRRVGEDGGAGDGGVKRLPLGREPLKRLGGDEGRGACAAVAPGFGHGEIVAARSGAGWRRCRVSARGEVLVRCSFGSGCSSAWQSATFGT